MWFSFKKDAKREVDYSKEERTMCNEGVSYEVVHGREARIRGGIFFGGKELEKGALVGVVWVHKAIPPSASHDALPCLVLH